MTCVRSRRKRQAGSQRAPEAHGVLAQHACWRFNGGWGDRSDRRGLIRCHRGADPDIDSGAWRLDLLPCRGRTSHSGPLRSQRASAVTSVQVLAFIITPLWLLAVGAAVALWARREADGWP